MNRDDLRAALSHPNVVAFLRVIRNGESSQSDGAYRLENGGKVYPECPVEHPSKGLKSPPGKAFGAYQFLASTWAGLVTKYGFTAMTPDQQDEAAIALIAERKALDAIKEGRFDDACRMLHSCWTSLPGGSEENKLTARARAVYEEWGGSYSQPFNPDSLETEHYGDPMPLPLIPLITAFGPELVKLIPQFASMFGSGSEVQIRNAKAAEAAVSAVVEATQSPNLQAAIEKMQADPEAAKAGQIAAAEVLALVEVGGGIVEARKASYDASQVDWWKNPAVIVAILVLPLVYMVVSAVVFGAGGQTWSDDVKTLTVTAILSGALGSITGFFLGSSLGSQRKTNILAKE